MTHAEQINRWLLLIGAGSLPASLSKDALQAFSESATASLEAQITKAGRPVSARTNKKLYFSEIGGGCFRKTWYKCNQPDHGKVLTPHERIKLMYGDQVESLIIALAKGAGLNVHSFQREVEVPLKDGWSIRGRIDMMIDDTLVDVKSTTTRGFEKFKNNALEKDDPFGYRWQLGGYAAALGVNKAEFLAFDKQLGHLVSCPLKDIPSLDTLVAYGNGLVDMVQESEPPDRPSSCDPVPDGKSGNMKLCTTCSYCPYNDACYKEANGGEGLKTYLYSTGPVSLVKVVNEPRVLRIK